VALDPTSRHGTALASPHVPRCQTRLPATEGSEVPTCPAGPDPASWRERAPTSPCPVAPGPPANEGGLWCHRVSHGSRLAPGMGGLWRRHVPRGSRSAPCTGRLQRRHMPHGSQRVMGHMQKGNTQPVYLLGRAHLPLRRVHAFPRRLASGSS
jgi:hypothetical protein